MCNNIVLRALETELKRQEKLHKDVIKKIEYNPISVINDKYKELESIEGYSPNQCKLRIQILGEISKIRKGLQHIGENRIKQINKQFDYEENILILKNAIGSEKLKIKDPLGSFVRQVFNRINKDKEGDK